MTTGIDERLSQPPDQFQANDSYNFQLTIVLEYPEEWISLHQCLLMLFDSPLNHAGYLKVYIRLEKTKPDKLIELHPEIRVPRTFKRFEQLFSNFLQGNELPLVETHNGQTRLINYVTKAFKDKMKLNQNEKKLFHKFRIINLAPKLRTPQSFGQLIDLKDITPTSDIKSNSSKYGISSKQEMIISIDLSPVDYNILGTGRETDYEIKTVDITANQLADQSDCCSLSRYPLSSALVCVKLTSAIEEALKVL